MSDMEYIVQTSYQNGIGVASARGIDIPIDGAEDGAHDAFNPVELLLSAVSTCLTKGVVRAARMNKIRVGDIEVRIRATRQNAPPKVTEIVYEVSIDTEANVQQLELIDRNIKKFGTITNTVGAAVPISGGVSYLRRDVRLPAATN